ncbi:MAG: PIG-L family deacetylase [Candidatus Omnitrophica bacterium]|nr:PIG-L family deacetylase [Candidatus Omnitrophota bacterium]
MKPAIFWLAGLVILSIASSPPSGSKSTGPELPSLAPWSPKDRILVVAPHEDDEALGAGGVIQQAVSAGAAVRIVYLTYGDYNELAFLLYRRRLWLSPAINEKMGELRRQESTQAMAALGVPAQQLIFLGYPDGGTLEIWKQHWGPSTAPLQSLSTRKTRVPYAESLSYNKPHKGESILADMEHQLLDFKPTHIFVTQPVDAHPDHKAAFLFLQVALLNVADVLPNAQLLTYPIHIGRWPHPKGFRPEDWLSIPKLLADEAVPWRSVELTPEQVRRKYEVISLFKTQMVDNARWLTSFARRNELFMTPVPTRLEDDLWSPSSGMLPPPEIEESEQESPIGNLGGVSFERSPKGLAIQVALRQSIEQEAGFSIYAFGYRRDRPFEAMPKIHLRWSMEHLLTWNQKVLIPHEGVRVEKDHLKVTVIIPWEMLGAPEAIFVQTQGLLGGIPVSQTAWRLLTQNR